MPLTPEELEQQTQELLSLERIVQMYRLDALFGLAGFEGFAKMTIEVFPKAMVYTTRGVRTAVPDCWPLMEGLVEWLRRGFERRGKKVEVRLVESVNEGLRWGGGSERGGGGNA